MSDKHLASMVAEPADELAAFMKTFPDDPQWKFVLIVANVATDTTTRVRNSKRGLHIMNEEKAISAKSTKMHNRFVV
jgi:hypothetical protein